MTLAAEVDLDALLALAERLHGRPCRYDKKQKRMVGCMNWAITVSFDDGIDWIFRSPTPNTFTDEMAASLLESEVATTQCVAERTTIPVPTIFAYR